MNTLECIKRRVSVRRFKDNEVEEEKIREITDAGLQAPTAMDSRDIVLTVLRGKSLAAVQEAMKKNMDDELRSHFYIDGKFDFCRGGKAVIVVSLGKDSVLPEQNTGCIMENMYLAATELGLGACWINQFYDITTDEVREILGLKSGYKPYAGLSIGYIKEMPKKKERDGLVVFKD